MPASSPSDHGELDWARARRVLVAYLRHRLPFAGEDVSEDLAQEALVRLYRMNVRAPVRTLEAVANTIADSVVLDHLRCQKRRAAFLRRWALNIDARGELDALGDPMDRIYFVVIAFFRKAKAPCADLAEHYFSKVEWKELAERRGRTPAEVRKQWSRCTDRLRRAFGDDDGPLKWWFDE